MISQQNRIQSLDSLRGVAAIAVVFYHYLFLLPSKYGLHEERIDYFYHFQVGVHLFFMISGFVIFMTITKCDNLFQFIWGRFSRLYPVYWCAVILTFLIVTIFGPTDRSVSIKEALINLTMFQEYLSFRHVDGVYWTLSIELAFYILIGCAFSVGLIKYTEYICVLWVSIALGVKIFDINVGIFEQILLLDWCQYFAAGIAYHLFWKKNNEKILPIIILLLSITYTCVATAPDLTFSIISIHVLFILAIYVYSAREQLKLFQWLGSISYSLYLIHQNIGYSIILNLQKNGVDFLVAVFFAVVVVLVIATLLHIFIEAPSLRVLRSIKQSPKVIKAL